MSDPAIIDAAARALAKCGFYDNEAIAAARTMLIAATPLILEKAAKVAEDYNGRGIEEDYAALTCEEIATAIRALKRETDKWPIQPS